MKWFGLEDPVATPADVSVILEADDGVSKLVDQQNYQQIIGSLLYASRGIRPDVTFIVGVLARYCGKPNQLHLTDAKRVLRYLKGTAKLALTYTAEGNASLTGYSDADWAGDRDTRRSTSGMTFMLQGASITWSSKRQASVALSTVEAEYMALSQATQEASTPTRRSGRVYQGRNDDNGGQPRCNSNCTKHIQISYHHLFIYLFTVIYIAHFP